jgi:hypothetical protein
MECPGLEQSCKRLSGRRDIKQGPHLDSRSALSYIDNPMEYFYHAVYDEG